MYRQSTILLVLFAIILAACGGDSKETPATAELPVVRYVNFRVYDPVYVAIDQGFFNDHGIEVEIIGDVLAGPTGIEAVTSGAAEAGLSSLPAIINANAAGLPIEGVSDIQSALPGQPLEYYYVRCDSGIESLADLSGKDFAVNLLRSSFHYTALLALELAQISEDEINFVLLSFDDQIPALAEGEVDVIGLIVPYNEIAQASYSDEFCLLFDAIDVFGERQFSTHFINRVWARINPDQATAFVSGVVDAVNWIEDNQESAKAIIAEYTGIEKEFIPVYHFQENGQVVEDDVVFWLDYLVGRGDVTADSLVPSEIAHNDYNPYVDK